VVPVVDSHAFDFARRHILLDQRVAAVLAHRHAVQSAGLFDLRLPLELFRYRLLALCLAIISWFFKTGYRLKN
jgi:hypothetical protein